MISSVSLVERGGPCFLPAEDCARLNLDEPLQALSRRGIVKAERTSTGVLITPQSFVGELRVFGSAVRISPKSRLLLEAMQALAVQGRVITMRHTEEGKVLQNESIQSLAAVFLDNLTQCIYSGVPWDYVQRGEQTSFPRGKIKFGDTLRKFAARGVHHKVVVHISRRVQDRDLSRVVHATVKCIQSLGEASGTVLARIYQLLALFTDATAFRDIEEACASAMRVHDREFLKQNRAGATLALLCFKILSDERDIAGAISPMPGGIAIFRSLEKLWEKCIYRMLENSSTCSTFGLPSFHGLAALRTTLFDPGGPDIDPDIVFIRDKAVTCIVDAKYKRLDVGVSPDAADIYQIYSYVRRTGAAAGLLIYFSESESNAETLGTTPEGALIVVIRLSGQSLIKYGESALENAIKAESGLTQELIKRSGNSLS